MPPEDECRDPHEECRAEIERLQGLAGKMVGAAEPKEFAERMKAAVCVGGDIEMSHSDGDDLMCELLDSLGYGEGVQIFRDSPKWYA